MADRHRNRSPQNASSTIEPTPVQRRQRPAPPRGIPPVAIIIVAVLALIGVGGLIVAGDSLRAASLTNTGDAPNATNPSASQPNPSAQTPATGGQPAAPGAAAPGTSAPASTGPVVKEGTFKGAKDAPVQIVEYADFQCPFCQRAALGPMRQVDEAFIQTGKANVVFKHFPFIGPESVNAAMASECAADQNKFWEYHDKLFSSQAGENTGAFGKDKLKSFATDVGLDRTEFDACLDDQKHMEKVRNDFEEGQRLGVQSTPTFMVNDQRLLGARPFADFQKAIEQELTKVR